MITAWLAYGNTYGPDTPGGSAPKPPVMNGPMWMPDKPPTLWRLVEWHWQPVPLYPVLMFLFMGLYAYGVYKLRQRGLTWPVHRTILWMSGSLSVAWVTSSGIEGYGMMLFSAHMFQHMTLSMLAPILMLLGAPMTLLLRALPANKGFAGRLRRLVLDLLHSRFMKAVTHPLFTWPLFIGTLYGIYFSPVFDQLMSTLPGHLFMLGHFLISGILFFGPVLAIDPWPRRSGHLARIMELLMGTPIHAFFGVIIMMTPNLLVDFFAHPPPSWGIDPMSDQTIGGSIAWMFGELPTLGSMFIIAHQWYHSETRKARRSDRQARRDGDAQLKAYNDWLRGLHGLEPRHHAPQGPTPDTEPAAVPDDEHALRHSTHQPSGTASDPNEATSPAARLSATTRGPVSKRQQQDSAGAR